MYNKIKKEFSNKIHNLIVSLRGFEETGNIIIDSLLLETRDLVKEAGAL